MAAKTGQGTSLEFETSGLAYELTSIDPYGRSWESIDTTHLETEDAMTSMPSDLPDNGEMAVEGHYDPDQDEPETNEIEYAKLTFPGGAIRRMQVFWMEFSPSIPVNDRMTFSGRLKITGAITKVAGS